MSEHHDTRSSEEIQRDIERTRAEMGETLDAIRDKLSPGEILDQALSYFKSNRSGNGSKMGETASQWASDLGDTLKHNPVPVALIGAGLAWLMMGGSRRTVRAESHSTRYDRYDAQIYDAYDMPVSTPGTPAVSSGMREHGGPAPLSTPQERSRQESSSSMRERAGEMTSGVQERVSDMAAGARDRIGHMASSTRHRLSDSADRLRHQASRQGGKTQETFNYLRDEQPLVLGALGFALGAALGAGLPPTQREDELMGESRDQVIHRAQQMGEEQLEKAKHVASAASRAAQEQAEKEGLTQESADQALNRTAEKVERVANASVEAAKREAGQTPPSTESTPTTRP
jgi:hypothetical protein